jgi:hypothetical protein
MGNRKSSGEDLSLNENIVTMLRNKVRIKLLKERNEAYRNFINGFELPNKLKRRVLRKGNRYNIKNLNNFQYSLGLPKAVEHHKTSININGLKGEVKKFLPPSGLKLGNHRSANAFAGNRTLKMKIKKKAKNTSLIFKQQGGKKTFLLPSLRKPFYLCQSSSGTDPKLKNRMQ